MPTAFRSDRGRLRRRGIWDHTNKLHRLPARVPKLVHIVRSHKHNISRRQSHGGNSFAFCGVSGSGKTSLAVDTLYAKGQRRYIESFSAYARQFLDRLEKPAAERIDGLPQAFARVRLP